MTTENTNACNHSAPPGAHVIHSAKCNETQVQLKARIAPEPIKEPEIDIRPVISRIPTGSGT